MNCWTDFLVINSSTLCCSMHYEIRHFRRMYETEISWRDLDINECSEVESNREENEQFCTAHNWTISFCLGCIFKNVGLFSEQSHVCAGFFIYVFTTKVIWRMWTHFHCFDTIFECVTAILQYSRDPYQKDCKLNVHVESNLLEIYCQDYRLAIRRKQLEVASFHFDAE